MIVKLIGTLDEIREDETIINVNNVCYGILTTNNSITGKGIDDKITIYIQSITKEDGTTLYGFKDNIEKEWFNKLIKINGVGGKMALSILNNIGIQDLFDTIYNKDEKNLTSISGIGKKIANRIILEMQNNITKLTIYNSANKTDLSLKDSLFSALTNMGFGHQQANQTANDIIKNKPHLTLEEMIKQCLIALS